MTNLLSQFRSQTTCLRQHLAQSSFIKIFRYFSSTNDHAHNLVIPQSDCMRNKGLSLLSMPQCYLQAGESRINGICQPIFTLFHRSYKTGSSVKLRCRGCYFVRKNGRLFVECEEKPRHKQMQTLSRYKLWREEYCKGNTRLALHWGWQNRERFYWNGEKSAMNFKSFIQYDGQKT